MANQFIQSNLNPPGNFEVVVLERNGDKTQLVHYWRNNTDPSLRWHPNAAEPLFPTDIVSTAATAAGAIIQSTFNEPTHPGSFKVLVLENENLKHYYRDNSKTGNGFVVGGLVTTGVSGAASFIQSTYNTPNFPGNFEAVVLQDRNLVHWYRQHKRRLDTLDPG
jgi:hypothetical protein